MVSIKVLNPEEMRKCDSFVIKNKKIPSIVLMERAAHSVCEAIYEEQKRVPVSALIVCGTGNNAGDGLAIARELSDQGCCCTVWMCMGINKLSRDTLLELNILIESGCRIVVEDSFDNEGLYEYEIVVDAIFGTGLNRSVSPSVDKIMKRINQQRCKKFSVDVPSGIDSKTGLLLSENPFNADITVTFAFPKTGTLFYPAKQFVGVLKTTYIGIPFDTPEKINWGNKFNIEKEMIRNRLPNRDKSGHKGSFGKLCVIGGSEKYKGAPILSMKGALRTGVGLVKGILPRYSNSGYHYSNEMIVEDEYVNKNHHGMLNYNTLMESAMSYDAAVIGPGLGRGERTKEFARHFISEYAKPLLIDADALFAISGGTALEILAKRTATTIITPHIVEFSRLIEKSIDDIKLNRLSILKEFASKFHSTIVLKDSTTTICTPAKKIYINTTGNDGLATGGSGDVLSGIIGTYLAQGNSGEDSSVIGVYIHGLSVELYSEKNYPGSFIPSDICEMLPETLREVLK